ncbi:MAG: fused DSP-PTPase phosphatase/NAD kinase-like protein [Blastocatellia bacterium]
MYYVARQNRFARLPKINLTKAVLISSLVILAIAIPALGPPASDSLFKEPTSPAEHFASVTIKVKNFGQMDDHFYRGAQPKQSDYKDLAALGIKTIIDLRDDPTSYEKREAEAAGMRYVNIPMSDKERPKNEQIASFFSVANDQANWPFYVHCVGGRHRTGLIGAMYRYNKYGWDYDAVYKEMKNYDYYSRWGHGAIKDFVQEYYQAMKLKSGETTAETATSAAGSQAEPSHPETTPPPPKPKE